LLEEGFNSGGEGERVYPCLIFHCLILAWGGG
jgi:hypothetical protein